MFTEQLLEGIFIYIYLHIHIHIHINLYYIYLTLLHASCGFYLQLRTLNP